MTPTEPDVVVCRRDVRRANGRGSAADLAALLISAAGGRAPAGVDVHHPLRGPDHRPPSAAVATPAPGQPPTTTASWPTPHSHPPERDTPGARSPDSLQRSPRRPARHRHTPGHTAAATAAPPVPRPHPTDRRYSALTATPPRRAAVSACASWAAARDPSLTHHRRNPAPPPLPHCGRSPRRGGRVRGARRALRSDCGTTVLCGGLGSPHCAALDATGAQGR